MVEVAAPVRVHRVPPCWRARRRAGIKILHSTPVAVVRHANHIMRGRQARGGAFRTVLSHLGNAAAVSQAALRDGSVPRFPCGEIERRNMPEVVFTGPAGRIEGRYQPAKQKGAPIAIILHPHPQFGGTMNNQIVYSLFYTFVSRGFSVLRFNFRGVGRSQGAFDHGPGELSDAAAALDWAQSVNADARACWI